MPSWKKLLSSGSSGSLAQLNVDTSVNATSFTGSLLRLDENGTGLRLTNVGAFDNSSGDFRIFANQDLIISTNGESGTAVTFDQTTKDANFVGAVTASAFKGDGSQLTGIVADGTISGSSQVDITQTNGYSTFSGSIDTHLDTVVAGLSASAHTARSTGATSASSHDQRIALVNNLSSSAATALRAEYVAGDSALSSSAATALRAEYVAADTALSSSQKTYIDAKVAGIVNSAPATLDTLDELAAALGDDATFSASIATSIGNRVQTSTFDNYSGSAAGALRTEYVAGDTALSSSAHTQREALKYTDAKVKTKLDADGVLSGSSQVSITGTTGYATFSASIDTHLDANISALSSSAHSDRVAKINVLSASVDTHLDAEIATLSASAHTARATGATSASSHDQRVALIATLSASVDTHLDANISALSSSAATANNSSAITVRNLNNQDVDLGTGDISAVSGSFTKVFGDGSGLTGVESTVTEQVTVSDTFTNVSAYTASHTFDTKDVFVHVYDDNDRMIIPEEITTLTTTSVGLDFGTALTGRVIIGKSGHIVSGSIPVSIVSSSTVSDTFTSVTAYTASHTLNTKDVIVNVYDENDRMVIPEEITTLSTTSVGLDFGTALTGRVVIGKSGHIVSGSADYTVVGSDITDLGNLTVSGSILPHTTDTYDLGSPTKQWRDLYLSNASLYVDGVQILSSTSDTLTFTTDTGQSIKLLEEGADDIILQTDTGNIELKGTVEILSGKKITDSASNVVRFGNSIGVTGSIETTGTVDGIDLQVFSSSVATGLASAGGGASSWSELSDIPSGIVSSSAQITLTESQITDLTHYTDSDTLTYINSLGVVSGSVASDWDSISSKPAGIVSSSAQITALTSYTETFTSQTAVTASHSLGTKNVTVQVYGSDDYMIFPTSIKTHDDNNVYVQFNSSRSGRIVITK